MNAKMLGRISRKLLSRRLLKEGQSFSHQTTSSQYAQTPGSESRGDVLLSSGEDRIQWLHCANQAHLPARDAKILEVNAAFSRQHLPGMHCAWAGLQRPCAAVLASPGSLYHHGTHPLTSTDHSCPHADPRRLSTLFHSADHHRQLCSGRQLLEAQYAPGAAQAGKLILHGSQPAVCLAALARLSMGTQSAKVLHAMSACSLCGFSTCARCFSSCFIIQAEASCCPDVAQMAPFSLLLHPLQVAALGDIPKAFRAAMFALDRAWRDMHPFNHNVLDGVSLAAAYVDLTTDTLYVASTGGCRVLVGSRAAAGNLQITTDVGENEGSRGLSGGIATVQLTEDVDSIILGSAGLW